uniref:Uncharacterized protein n=1 Tax=Moumouvirus australiensis transpoviron TaxID=2711276 RepID=A0A2P1EHH5_9VIRU|nr:hypothetical protein matv_4 [Moumouvirus australiensis transpoviron]
METLLAASHDKSLLLKEENIELKAEVIIVKEYFNKALDENDKLKTKLSKYEPTNNQENKNKINNLRNILSMSEEKMKELENKKMEEMKKKYSEIYASKYSSRFN